jgi:hypothetical protein
MTGLVDHVQEILANGITVYICGVPSAKKPQRVT